MVQVKHGNISVEIPFALPEQAGHLDAKQVAEIAKVARGIGLVCDASATALEHVGPKLVVPQGVTPAALREAGDKAERIDQVIADVELVLVKLKQANLLLDEHAYELLRKLNDQVKAQGKFDEELRTAFRTLTDYMGRGRRSSGSEGGPTQK